MILKNEKIGLLKSDVPSYLLDAKSCLSIFGLTGLFQEIAGKHADANGFGFDAMVKTGNIWVLTRLKIKINHLPGWNNSFQLKTWVANREKFFSRREFLLLDKSGNKLAAAASGWMLINIKTKRPVHVDTLDLPFPLYPELVVNEGFEKIVPVKNSSESYYYTVQYSDLDMNKHVNNTQYIRILINSFDMDFLLNNRLKSFDINYLAEATYKDELSILTYRNEKDFYIQEIFRQKDQKVICRSKSKWQEL